LSVRLLAVFAALSKVSWRFKNAKKSLSLSSLLVLAIVVGFVVVVVVAL